MSKAPQMASEVNILKTKAANKKGAGSEDVETVWPKPEFGASTTIDNVTDETKIIKDFVVPAGSMFSLGAALPNHTVLKWGAYFPPGTMNGIGSAAENVYTAKEGYGTGLFNYVTKLG
ncbi:hypothetical protein I316_07170 [Kwoniella heveanensis BCC8398]|uniref:Uncharacterized protein n=1 Tax=Kwoniella heveanensis BCC8398 TaxID=1296120 RepID=A0A1B9GJD2_9TREE|nr:hypothetical protein I316_07170 [Kwoniella heveanensis BCC8398]